MLKLKFNREKISFDFDGTLSTQKGQDMAKAKMEQGYKIGRAHVWTPVTL